MYLSQALAVLSVDPNCFYLPAEIAASMPIAARNSIQDSLRQFAAKNYFHGYDDVANARSTISMPEMRKLQVGQSPYCEYRLAGNHQYVRAYVGSLWIKHCRRKSLEEATVFALASVLLSPGLPYSANRVLAGIPLLETEPEMQKRMLVQIQRLCRVYQMPCDRDGDAYPGAHWASFVGSDVRRNVMLFLTSGRSHLSMVRQKPQMIAACIPFVNRFARRYHQHLHCLSARPAQKPEQLPSELCSYKPRKVSCLEIERPKRVNQKPALPAPPFEKQRESVVQVPLQEPYVIKQGFLKPKRAKTVAVAMLGAVATIVATLFLTDIVRGNRGVYLLPRPFGTYHPMTIYERMSQGQYQREVIEEGSCVVDFELAFGINPPIKLKPTR